LRDPNEQHSVRAGEAGQIFLGHVVLSLSFAKVHQRHTFPRSKRLDGGDKRIRHRAQQRGGDHLRVSPILEKPRYTPRILQLRDINIQIQPVQTRQFQRHMIP
jgi:hypothetical protein